MLRRIIDATRTVLAGVKNLWTKYHFMVPMDIWKKEIKYVWGILTNHTQFLRPMDVSEYNIWLQREAAESQPPRAKLKYQPLISVLVPVYNVGGEYLRECIDSVLKQSYENYEVCLVDDKSDSEETLAVLEEYKKNPKVRIRHREENGNISRATNDALKMAKGEFVALLDNDDLLMEDALYEVVKVLNEDKKLDLIYSDEDKIDRHGQRCYPHFKTDFAPDTLMSLNYICHLTVVRKKLLDKIGGFTVGLEGAQDYDMVLRATEQTKRIYHIPKVLYHWRMIKGSTALKLSSKSYASDKEKMAIEAALKRRGLKGVVEKDESSTHHKVVYGVEKEPLVSVIIPLKDLAKVTRKCLESIYEKTTYKNFEVILVNNRSEEKETFELFDEYKAKHKNFRVVDADIEFNYSKINNMAVKKAKGEVVILLNNDTEIITPEWMTIMVGYATLSHVGAVGAKLLYPDNTVQHAGVVIGLGGVAGHVSLGEKRKALGWNGRLRVPYDYGAVTGACLCVTKSKFLEVGGLEEKGLKVAFNDIDFCMKLLAAGYYNVMLPMVELYHYESKSRGLDTVPEKRERFNKEVKFMQDKWGDKLLSDPFYNPNFSLDGAFVIDREKK